MITQNVPESAQESGFMNATLQSAGEKIAFSISTSLTVPKEISDRGQQAVAEFIENALKTASAAVMGLNFDVQIGPSLDEERELENHPSRPTGA